MVETTADGWWYTSPIPDSRIMVMLMTDADLCGRADLSSSATWWEHLQTAEATRARVAAGGQTWGPRVFSAVSQRLRRRDRHSPWLAVGDASLAVDPISGGGVVRALRSARVGADTALAILEGRSGAIDEYEANRDDEFTAYLQERGQYYGIEKRWSGIPSGSDVVSARHPATRVERPNSSCPRRRVQLHAGSSSLVVLPHPGRRPPVGP